MINIVKKFILLVIIDWLGIIICHKIFPDVLITNDLKTMLVFLIILALLTIIIKPLLNIVLKPFIVLTLGILSIVINMGLIYVANYYSHALITTSNFSLFKVVVAIGLVNFVINLVGDLN